MRRLLAIAVVFALGCDSPQGPMGDPGAMGAMGAMGATGVMGATGPGGVGPPGTPGPTGPAGPTGTIDPNQAILNGTALQTASFNISGDGYLGGNVGIGTTTDISAPAPLTVLSSVADSKAARFLSAGTHDPTTTGMAGIALVNTDVTANSLAGITFFAADDGGITRHNGGIANGKDANWVSGNGSYPGYMSFFTRPDVGEEVERIRITSAGDVGMGTTTPASRLDLGGGCMTGTMCSDARLKTNIRPLVQPVLDRVMHLKASTFEWRAHHDGRRHIGMIAQDVQRVFPEVVSTAQDGTQMGVECTGLNAIAFEAIKEQQGRIDRLEAELRSLKRRK